MKLNTKALRYLTTEDWRVLTAVETGSRNHEVVPTPLIVQLSGLRSANSGVQRSISTLAKANLIAKVKNAKYDGYRLTYGGLDYLSLHTLLKQNTIYSVGNQIGVGKESDIFVVADSTGRQHVLKIHRLGRISFRTVKNNRDYLRNRQNGSWMYMSRLAALKEYTFMKALWEVGIPVPEPRAQNRHVVLMDLVDGFPLRQIKSVPDPRGLYAELMGLIIRFAGVGLIHGDFNEFNILVKEVEDEEEGKQGKETDVSLDGEITRDEISDPTPPLPENTSPTINTINIKLIPIVIDFPQMVSIDHPDAESYFKRDVDCIKRFFERRFRFTSDDPGPTFEDARNAVANGSKRLDVEASASGFSKKMAKELEEYMRVNGVKGDGEAGEEGSESAEEGDEDEDEDEDGVISDRDDRSLRDTKSS